MKRRTVLLGWMAVMVGLPATAAETTAAARSRARPKASSNKPGVAERSNNRVRRAAESNTAGKVKAKANKGDDAMNRLVGRRSSR